MPGHPTRSPPATERRWPPVFVIVLLLLLVAGLPDHVRMLPSWAPYLVAAAAWLPMAAVALARDKRPWLRIERGVTLAAGAFILATTVDGLVRLIRGILGGSSPIDGIELLSSSVVLWVCNIVAFSLLFWQVDGGGPAARAESPPPRPDWLFPQATAGEAVPPGWRPVFADYLYLAFSTATAFSSTDAPPLTVRAKLLMMGAASVSLVTMVVVASRAINVLGS